MFLKELINWSDLATWIQAIASILGIVIALTFALQWKRNEINRSRYNDEQNRAVLSMMRDSYEAQIARLTERLTATPERWNEVNHLVIDAQNIVPHRDLKASNIAPERFLSAFGIEPNKVPVDERLAFVLTPFSAEESEAYEAIKDGCIQAGFHPDRGDETFVEGPILGHILLQIARAALVIANIGSRNPNVFYELGIAQALGKPTILISRTLEDVPFDLRHMRVLFFNDTKRLPDLIREELQRFEEGSAGKFQPT